MSSNAANASAVRGKDSESPDAREFKGLECSIDSEWRVEARFEPLPARQNDTDYTRAERA